MKFCVEDKDMLNFALSQLKAMGIKVPKIKKMKTAISKQDKGSIQSRKVFGVCLADQEQFNSSNLPRFILSCTEYLQKYSKEIGLFRKAGSISRQKKLRVTIENGASLDGAEPNDVASLLKQWLRELPEPLVPCYLYDSFIRCQQLNNNSRITATLLICLLLPAEHLVTLKHLMGFLAVIAKDEDVNNMDIDNLALIMTPNVFVFSNNSIDKSSSLKIQQLTAATKLLIKNASEIGEIPPTLLFKFPIQESESESISLSQGMESSPSLSRKHYLLRSIKRLVKQNETSVANSTVTPATGHNFLRHTLSVSNMEKASLKSLSENKGNYNFFGTRNSEDVCKRSFRLLRKKNKRGLTENQDFHPFTQSLEIERPLNYQMEVDDIKIFPSDQGSSSMDKSNSERRFNFNHLDGNRPVLEDIEMTTFSTRLNGPSDNLVAFPIFSQRIQSNNFASKLEKVGQAPLLNTTKTNKNYDKCVNFPEETNAMKLTEMSKDILFCDNGCPIDKKKGMPHSKAAAISHSSISFPENPNNFLNVKVSLFKNLMANDSVFSENDTMSIKTNVSNTQCSIADIDRFQLKKEVLDTNSAEETDAYQLLRQTTFVIEPSQNISTENLKRPCIDEQKCKRVNMDNNLVREDAISCKRQCTNLNAKNKAHHENLSVKRVVNKSVNSERTSANRSRPSIKQIPLQKTKNETRVKGCSNLTIKDKKKEDLKLFHDQTSPNGQHETASWQSSSRRGEMDNTQNTLTSCLAKSTFSENSETLLNIPLGTNLVPNRKLSFSRYPVTASSYSDSKIPRLKNSSEVPAANSFSAVTSCSQKDIRPKSLKTTSSRESITRIPIKCNDSKNLSTLELSINDSCFLTPRRNAMLSPNSVVWMSGTKYFSSKSPEVNAYNKRESIAMILKTNSGHVQAKVHLYDDLVRESVDTTPNKPSHSTPTSKLNRNSLSSQSMKSTPKQRKNASNDKFTPSKKLLVSRSCSLRNENSLKSYQPKFILHTDAPSPIKSILLKDVTNTSIGSKSSINNFQIDNEKIENAVKSHKKLKRNSFSGNNSKKFVKKISRSESSPGCQRPYLKVTCLIQESNCEL